MKQVTIINTGGTFNKIYNPLTGDLDIQKDNKQLRDILKNFSNIDVEIINIISKDSLDFTSKDREFLVKSILNTEDKNIIVIHGTDTMSLSAKFVSPKVDDKKIIFTGAMVPLSIDTTEAIMNLSLAFGFLNSNIKNGTYISMHGIVVPYKKIYKNKKLGQFLPKD